MFIYHISPGRCELKAKHLIYLYIYMCVCVCVCIYHYRYRKVRKSQMYTWINKRLQSWHINIINAQIEK